MVKSVLSVAHQGLRDWIIQRISAVILTLYIFALAYYFLTHPALNYLEWHQLFAHLTMKIATLFFVLALALHAWVGIWTVVTDYVHPALLRFMVHVLVFSTLSACVIWAFLLMMWSA